MKKEIVYTDKYALILSDEGLRIGDYYVHYQKSIGLRVLLCGSEVVPMDAKKIAFHLPLSDAPIIEGVPLLPQLPQGDDVDTDMFYHKQVMNPYPTDSQSFTSYEKGFVEGYNKAKEKYKYTEEDVLGAMEIGFDIGKNFDDDNPNIGLGWLIHQKDNFIKSLQQPSRPTHFECEMVRLSSNESFGLDYGSSNLKPKTITNSQGQVELVGKYI
jgi:hypothetical protein